MDDDIESTALVTIQKLFDENQIDASQRDALKGK